MQEYDKNMHKYAIVKYAQICTNMQKICKKYAQICNNMQGLSTLQNRQKYANYMQKYAQICTICNQGFHMQNMHEYALPTLLMMLFPASPLMHHKLSLQQPHPRDLVLNLQDGQRERPWPTN